MQLHYIQQINTLYSTEYCLVSALSLGWDDPGCDENNHVNCAVLTLNGVEIRPFAELAADGAQRGLAVMVMDEVSCSVVVSSVFVV